MNGKRGKVAAITSSGKRGCGSQSIAMGRHGTQERSGAAAVNRSGLAIHRERNKVAVGSHSQT